MPGREGKDGMEGKGCVGYVRLCVHLRISMCTHAHFYIHVLWKKNKVTKMLFQKPFPSTLKPKQDSGISLRDLILV